MPTPRLPADPDVNHLRRQAKALHKAYRAQERDAFARIRAAHPRFTDKSDDEIRAASLPLAEAQFTLAREYGFDNWEQMKARVAALRGSIAPQWRNTGDAPVNAAAQDDPRGRERFDRMLRELRGADSLYVEIDFVWRVKAQTFRKGQCRMWLKKPGYARLENLEDGAVTSALIGDGKRFWRTWPGGRPQYSWEDPAQHERAKLTSYMVEEQPANRFSIWHAAKNIGAHLILNPSAFHGYNDPMLSYVDSIACVGVGTAAGEDCDVIEVSLMKGQRVQALWLSLADGLPRKVEQRLYVNDRQFQRARWNAIQLNPTIDDSIFAWEPPADWVEFRHPSLEDNLLPIGADAPDFERTTLGGQRFRLSDARGCVVLLSFWRVGCKPCRTQAAALERLHQAFRDRGLVVIGMNPADEKPILRQFLADKGVTFPNILDTTPAGWDLFANQYQDSERTGMTALPLNYVINRDAVIAYSQYGFDEEEIREATLRQLAWDRRA